MLDYTWAKVHASLNDLPAALLFVAVLFDLAGWALKRETLRVTAVWSLWAGVLGGWVAYVAGKLAEKSIDHGDAIHELMERHEDLALYTMIVFTAVLAWRLWRRLGAPAAEEWGARLAGLVGLVLLIYTAMVGGRAVFDHAAGVTNADMQAEMTDRGIAPAPPAAPTPQTPGDTANAPATGGHEHAPGTRPHRH